MGPIANFSFDHGWYYIYRVHLEKLAELKTKFSELHSYLSLINDKCPNSYFSNGPRASKLKFNMPFEIYSTKNHELSLLAKHAIDFYKGRYKSNHAKVEVFLLEHDAKTVAVEVPLWFEPEEMKPFSKILDTKKPLTGHIDILQVEDDKIWIWDYKSDVDKEPYAATQTFFYAMMLSKRTGIPIENFRCGFFDDSTAHFFEPRTIAEELEKKAVTAYKT